MLSTFPTRDLDAYIARIYGEAQIIATPTSYGANFGTIAAGTTIATRQIQIQANADFIAISGEVENYDGSPSLANAASIQVIDSATGEQFFNEPMPIPTVFTVRQQTITRAFTYPRFIGGNTALTVNLYPAGEMQNTVVRINGVLIRRR